MVCSCECRGLLWTKRTMWKLINISVLCSTRNPFVSIRRGTMPQTPVLGILGIESWPMDIYCLNIMQNPTQKFSSTLKLGWTFTLYFRNHHQWHFSSPSYIQFLLSWCSKNVKLNINSAETFKIFKRQSMRI